MKKLKAMVEMVLKRHICWCWACLLSFSVYLLFYNSLKMDLQNHALLSYVMPLVVVSVSCILFGLFANWFLQYVLKAVACKTNKFQMHMLLCTTNLITYKVKKTSLRPKFGQFSTLTFEHVKARSRQIYRSKPFENCSDERLKGPITTKEPLYLRWDIV